MGKETSSSSDSKPDESLPQRSDAFKDPLYPDVLSGYDLFETANLDEAPDACLWLASLIEFMPSADASEYSERSRHERKLHNQLITVTDLTSKEARKEARSLKRDFPIALEIADEGFSERRLVTEARERLKYVAKLIRHHFPPPKRPNAFNNLPNSEALLAYEIFETGNLEEAARACMWLASLISYLPSPQDADTAELSDFNSHLDDQLRMVADSVPNEVKADVDCLSHEFPIALETAVGESCRRSLAREARQRLGYLAQLLRYRLAGSLEAVEQRIDFTKKSSDDIQALRHPSFRLDLDQALELLRSTTTESPLTVRAKCLLVAAASPYSLKEIGDRMGGMTQPNVSRLLNLDLNSNPQIGTLLAFANAVDMKLEEILRVRI